MKKIIILMPVYNDWESLSKVLLEINEIIKEIKNFEFNCIIINDCSTIKKINIKKPNYIKSIKIINMKENRGHARCNAFGVRYINMNEKFDYVIIMDSDGEDRPIEIKEFIKKLNTDPKNSIVAKRVKRSEGPIFQFLYQIHKLITIIFTGKKINFGNYSCLTKKDLMLISDKQSLWSTFSGTIKKHLKNFNEIDSRRGLRYFGPSKMSIFNLSIHSLSIIAAFKYDVLFRSFLLILILFAIDNFIGIFSLILQILLMLFCLLIFVVSRRENKENLFKSDTNVINEEKLFP